MSRGQHKNKSRAAGRGPRPLPSPAQRKADGGRHRPYAGRRDREQAQTRPTSAQLPAWKPSGKRQTYGRNGKCACCVGSPACSARVGEANPGERIGAQCLSRARKTASAAGPGIGYLRDGPTDAVRPCRRHAGCHGGTGAVARREHGSYHGAEPAAAGSLDLRRDTQLLRHADAGTSERRGRSYAGQRWSPLPRGHSFGFHIVGGGRHVWDARVERRAF